MTIVSEQNVTKLKPFTRAEMSRIVQEALNNIRRHAEASRVDISFQQLNGNLRVEIKDDGRGFWTEEIFSGENRCNFGVRSMTGRAKQLGGTLGIRSKPGEGTTVLVEIPLEKGAE
ncbi:MAG: sensor histidine kinase [Thermoleophilia bacterium]